MTNSDFLSDYIMDVPDFPKPGIKFKDITPLLESGEAFSRVIDEMKEYLGTIPTVNGIVALESRGFIFAAALAYATKLPLIIARKPGKLPRPGASISYEKEYGEDTIVISAGSIKEGGNYVVVDDLLATGGSALAVKHLIESEGGIVGGMLFLISLEYVGGWAKLRSECSNLFSALRYGVYEGDFVFFEGTRFNDIDNLRYNGIMDGFVVSADGDDITVRTVLNEEVTEVVVHNAEIKMVVDEFGSRRHLYD